MKWVIFDLDGTLLSMDLKQFEKIYFNSMADYFHIPLQDIVSAIRMSTEKVVKENNGVLTNEKVYEDFFNNRFADINLQSFHKYYQDKFDICKQATSAIPEIVEAVNILKEKGYQLAIATNPLFPRIATLKRVSWTGLKADDFFLISTYEDFHYTKPDIRFYKELLTKLGARTDECLMVGNDVQEDAIFESIGGKVYLITNHLINRTNEKISSSYSGSYQDFLEFVRKL